MGTRRNHSNNSNNFLPALTPHLAILETKNNHISLNAQKVKVMQDPKDPVHFWLSHLILFQNCSSKKEELSSLFFLVPEGKAQALVGGS